MYKLIISAPFGNYISVPGVTSTLGTYTLHKRAGLLKRLWKIISTVRYYPRTKSWINKLGLPNPGIYSLDPQNVEGKILSIHGFNQFEWIQLLTNAKFLSPLAIELNFSCPNVTKTVVQEALLVAIEIKQS